MENQIAKVTVSIASYNNSQYIERCVNSVINQTYSNLEILIVDDGSTDDTVSLLGKYQSDERIRVIVKENGGLSSVRQRALDEAKGNYICFIDADDYLAPSYVLAMLEKLLKDGSDICVCSTRFENEKGEILKHDTKGFLCFESKTPYQTTASNLGSYPNIFVNNLHLSDSWDKMYKLSSLRSYNVKFCMPKGLNGTDTFFNRLVALRAPLYSTVQDNLYIHVIYSRSAVHRKNKNLFSTYLIISEHCITDCKKLGIYTQMRNYLSTTFQSNFLDVLIDLYKESNCYIDYIKNLCFLKKEYKFFADRIKEDLLSPIIPKPVLVKMGIIIFKYASPFLPLFFMFFDMVKCIYVNIKKIA